MTVTKDESIIKSLEDISYSGPLLDKLAFAKAIEGGPKCTEYTEIVSFLTNELRSLCNIDEQVNKITSSEDSISFLMELSSFLKELGCPYDNLTQGHMSDRLVDLDDRRLLLEYLITELMAARIVQESKPDKKIELKLQETPNAFNMKQILTTLRFPKPPSNLSVKTLFSRLIPTVESNIKKGGSDLLGTPAFNLSLTDKQWHILQQVQHDLHNEYTIRREMLLKRLDCTIQSFQWSDRMKGKEELLTKTYTQKRKLLRVQPAVNLSDLLSARDDLAIIEKTSSASVRRNTRSAINNVIIGHVPDRGGRTDELAPPPPEMPSWQQRSAGPPGGGGGRGGRGGGQFQNTGRGRGDFSRGRGDFSRGGRQSNENDYNRRGSSDFGGGRGGSDYNKRGSSDYGGGRGGRQSNESDYNTRGSSDYGGGRGGRQSNESDYNRRGSSDYGGGRGGGGNYNRGGSSNDFGRGGNNYGEYNRGSYDNRKSGSFDSAGNYGGGASSYGGGSGNYSGFDSAGSYGGYKDYQSNEPKRAKTIDYFQTNKSTYADQYVQDSQHNQQYQSRDNRRGRSSYSRGGRY